MLVAPKYLSKDKQLIGSINTIVAIDTPSPTAQHILTEHVILQKDKSMYKFFV